MEVRGEVGWLPWPSDLVSNPHRDTSLTFGGIFLSQKGWKNCHRRGRWCRKRPGSPSKFLGCSYYCGIQMEAHKAGVNAWAGAQPLDRSSEAVAACRVRRLYAGQDEAQPIGLRIESGIRYAWCVQTAVVLSGLLLDHRHLSRTCRPAGVGLAPCSLHYATPLLERPVRRTPAALMHAAGYGRVPTAVVHTSAGSLLPTTDCQSPIKRGRLELDLPMARRGPGWCSAPTSPTPARTLLYAQEAVPRAPASHHPPVDLLDRLALLRRMSPATSPEPRASLHVRWAAGLAAGGSSGGYQRWAWDDGVASAQPIALAPAPGWRHCGNSVSVQTEHSGDSDVPHSGAMQQMLVLLASPCRHAAGLGTGPAAGSGGEAAAAALCPSSTRRLPFRPPGPLTHKAGNRPRPSSAPPPASNLRPHQARSCGCQRRPPVPVQPRRAAKAMQQQAIKQRQGQDELQEQLQEKQVTAVAICSPHTHPASPAACAAAGAGAQVAAESINCLGTTVPAVSNKQGAAEEVVLIHQCTQAERPTVPDSSPLPRHSLAAVACEHGPASVISSLPVPGINSSVGCAEAAAVDGGSASVKCAAACSPTHIPAANPVPISLAFMLSVKRREASLAWLLKDLDAISQRCDQLSATMQRPAFPINSSTAPDVFSKFATPAAHMAQTSTDWTWESLAAMERRLKEQHQKLVQSGVLPPVLGSEERDSDVSGPEAEAVLHRSHFLNFKGQN